MSLEWPRTEWQKPASRFSISLSRLCLIGLRCMMKVRYSFLSAGSLLYLRFFCLDLLLSSPVLKTKSRAREVCNWSPKLLFEAAAFQIIRCTGASNNLRLVDPICYREVLVSHGAPTGLLAIEKEQINWLMPLEVFGLVDTHETKTAPVM